MKWFSNLKIARKLSVSFAIVLTLMVGLGAFAIVQFAKLYEVTYSITSNRLPSINKTQEIQLTATAIRRFALSILLSDDNETREANTKNYDEGVVKLRDQIAKYETLVDKGEEEKLYAETRQKMQEFLDIQAQFLALEKQGEHKEAVHLSAVKGRASANGAIAAIAAQVAYNERMANSDTEASVAVYHSARNMVIGVLAFAVAMGIFLAMSVSRMIANPLRSMQEVAEKLALGDADQKIVHESKDEVGSLADSLRQVVDYNQNIARACACSKDSKAMPSRPIFACVVMAVATPNRRMS